MEKIIIMYWVGAMISLLCGIIAFGIDATFDMKRVKINGGFYYVKCVFILTVISWFGVGLTLYTLYTEYRKIIGTSKQ